jgi:hypothetical protein
VYNFADFLNRLEETSWDPAGHLDDTVLGLLAELDGERDLLYREVLSWAAGNLEYRGLRSHETTTHYKWFVYYHETLSFRVWLHQYKSADERVPGHAEVPHNHRYSLASLVISGGFDHHIFHQHKLGLREQASSVRPFRAGDTYTVRWDEIHKLSNLLDHTLTLVIESPIVRHYSEAFYADADRPRRFYDFAGLHSSLCEATRSASAGPSGHGLPAEPAACLPAAGPAAPRTAAG